MLVIELNKDIRSVGQKGEVFFAKPEGESRLRIHSSIERINGVLLHVSHAQIIGEVSTPEDRIIDGIVKIYDKWINEPATGDWEEEKRELAKSIYSYVKGEEENSQSG